MILRRRDLGNILELESFEMENLEKEAVFWKAIALRHIWNKVIG